MSSLLSFIAGMFVAFCIALAIWATSDKWMRK